MSACKLSAFVDISKVWNQMRQKTKGEMTESWSIPNCKGQHDAEDPAKGAGKAWFGRSWEKQREQEQAKHVFEAGGSDDLCACCR